jgi:acid phosphatase (class A)
MQKSFALLIYLLTTFKISQTQNLVVPTVPTELTPIRGHYKTLGELDPKPLSDHEAIDKLIFPYDEKFASKVLNDKPHYLKDVNINDFSLPDPPANSSRQTRAELNYLLGLQENRSIEDVRSSLYMSSVFLSPADMGKLIGYWFNSVKLPVTDSLFSNVAEDANYFLWSLKFKYKRVRPYMLDSKIHDLEESKASSYPSGHVTYAYIYAFIYALLAPEFTDYFIKDAYAMAHAREIIGVHYPSDSEASRIFARQLVNMLLKNQKFLLDLQKVKNEWYTNEKLNLHLLNESLSN